MTLPIDLLAELAPDATSAFENNCGPQIPNALLVPALVEQQARSAPDAIALVFGDASLTYGELDARANQVAHALRERGVTTESLVAVVLPRGIDPVVAFLGVWKAGGAYVPIDPDAPAERKAAMIANAAPIVVITSLEELELDQFDTAKLDVEIDPRSLAYAIYTSGSTGEPKGIVVEHGAVANYGTDVVRRWNLHPGDRVLGFAPFTFDSSIADLTGALISGATLYIRPSEIRGGEELARLLERTEATHALLPPVVWSSLPDVALPALRVAVTAGDACGTDVVDRWGQQRTLINEYGPTEITVCASSSVCVPGSWPTIGRAIANVCVYILDHQLAIAPFTKQGEIYVGGAGVARGYLGNPALTAERFVPDPNASGARMYRTGDLASRQLDGDLVFLGRVDHQVKIRGFRIELGEIETALHAHPNVATAVVVARTTQGEKALVAYVRLREPTAVSTLRDHLASLPEYMRPAAFVVLDVFPMTRNGKIDRNALPAPSDDAFERATYVAPSTPAELALAKIWREILRVDRIGIHDNFFALGGHSLLAVKMIERVARELGARLELHEVFIAPTIAQIAPQLRFGEASVSPIERRGLSSGSVALLQPYWQAMHEANPRLRSPLVIADAWRLRGPLDPMEVERAVNAVIERHEILRTSYEGDRQIVHAPPASYTYEETDDLARAITELVTWPIALDEGPVIRVKLVRFGADDHALLVLFHHIVFDGPSRRIFYRELAEAYRREALAPLPFQFLDVATHMHAYTESPEGHADLAYWTTRFADIPAPELPVDFPRAAPAKTSLQFIAHFPEAVVSRSDPALAETLAAVARREGVTLLVVYLASIAAMLHAETGQTDIALQTALDVRPLLGADSLIGPFNSPIFLRLDVSNQPSVRELLRRTRNELGRAYEHALVSPMQIVAEHCGRVNLGFVGQVAADGFALGAAIATPIPTGEDGTTPFDLRPGMFIDGAKLTVQFSYNTQLFKRETVERLCDRYLALLRSL